MDNVRRDHLEVTCSNLLLQQGHPEQAVQDHVLAAFENLQGWRLHNISGQPSFIQSLIWPIRSDPEEMARKFCSRLKLRRVIE